MISGNDIYYPDRKETQYIGIVPDIELKPAVQSIARDATNFWIRTKLISLFS
jgi:hypothetical protein